MKLRNLKGSRICLPNVPLWQNNYFELKATELKAVENRYRKSFLPALNLPKTDVSNHVPKLRFNCCCSEAKPWETSVDWKRKVALFRSLATWGEGSLISKGQLPLVNQQGEFLNRSQYISGRRGLHAEQHCQFWWSSWNWSSVVWLVPSWLF